MKRGLVRSAFAAGCSAASLLALAAAAPGGRSAVSSTAPDVSRVRPTTGPTSGSTIVTIVGTGFVGVTGVSFGPNPADPDSFQLISDTLIRAVSPPGGVGAVDVTVTTADGTSAKSLADLFTYVRPAAHDTQAPTEPGSLRGRFTGITLFLRWLPASDNVAVRRYDLYRNGVLFRQVPGKATTTSVVGFKAVRRTVFTLRAFDAARNGSAASNNVVVTPRMRPVAAPTPVPAWAPKLLAWERGDELGPRPSTPTPLPSWYVPWRAWRLAPYRISS